MLTAEPPKGEALVAQEAARTKVQAREVVATVARAAVVRVARPVVATTTTAAT
jgi:hypothetical protein